jgi:hypothetical protein
MLIDQWGDLGGREFHRTKHNGLQHDATDCAGVGGVTRSYGFIWVVEGRAGVEAGAKEFAKLDEMAPEVGLEGCNCDRPGDATP